ncbi:MAG: carboxypeptidase M32 [Rhodocyclaceae bacterium]|nr:carboxypeptidase M32 [Rhodocyclaceae bacterium]
MPRHPAYSGLAAHFERIHRLRHAAAMLAWDRATMMPPGGSGARARAEAEVLGQVHALLADPDLAPRLDAAAGEDLDDWQRANLGGMQRQRDEAVRIPAELVARRTLVNAACEHGWRQQRAANDWAGFLPAFREVVAVARDEARHLSAGATGGAYDALMARYEPGFSAARFETLFAPLVDRLPDLVRRARLPARAASTLPASCPVPRQRALCREIAALLGFDFGRGRLDESAHPFTGGVPGDVRITTRFDPADPLAAINSTIHECGHARYVQGLPEAWHGQPVGEPRSFGIHESQSLGIEMQLARSPAFCGLLAPLLAQHLGMPEDPATLHAHLTRVEGGRIRVRADEASYPLHVVLRFRIERALIEGEIEADDLPAMWDAGMAELLDIDTRGDYRDGCLQDIHWTKGAFGYFPSYTLGAMVAAQLFAALRREHADLDSRVADGDLSPVFDWLATHIWSRASRFDTDTLIRLATGQAIGPDDYLRHLERRYGEAG